MKANDHITIFKDSLKDTRFCVTEKNGICNNRILQITFTIYGNDYEILNNTGVEDFKLESELKRYINQEYATRNHFQYSDCDDIREDNRACKEMISILKGLVREERLKKLLDGK